MRNGGIPAVVTAGGRLSGDFAAKAGTDIKALLEIDGVSLLTMVVSALRESGGGGRIIVVGPEAITETAKRAGADLVLPEGATGPENMASGLRAIAGDAGEVNGGRAILAASDMYALTGAVVSDALGRAADTDGDILFPVVTRSAYEARFPDSPNVFAPVDGGEFTGGSLIFLRPAALERNRAVMEAVFEARKSQWAMARLLGINFLVKFLLRRLTIPEIENKASQITNCVCRALLDSDARLAADIDTQQEWEYASRRFRGGPPSPPINGGKGGRP